MGKKRGSFHRSEDRPQPVTLTTTVLKKESIKRGREKRSNRDRKGGGTAESFCFSEEYLFLSKQEGEQKKGGGKRDPEAASAGEVFDSSGGKEKTAGTGYLLT